MMVSKKRLNETDKVVGGHFLKDTVSVVIHDVRQTFQSFNIVTKLQK